MKWILVLSAVAVVAVAAIFFINRGPDYISRTEAIEACAKQAGVKNAPDGTETTFKEADEGWGFIENATWSVHYETRAIYLSCVVDAETGKVELGGSRSEGESG
jgi:hypothetical protein